MYVHMCGHGCVPVGTGREHQTLWSSQRVFVSCMMWMLGARAANVLHPCAIFPAPAWSWIPPPFPPWPISTGTQHWINMSGTGTSGTLSQSETVLFKVDCPGCFLYREKADIQVRCFCADRCTYIT